MYCQKFFLGSVEMTKNPRKFMMKIFAPLWLLVVREREQNKSRVSCVCCTQLIDCGLCKNRNNPDSQSTLGTFCSYCASSTTYWVLYSLESWHNIYAKCRISAWNICIIHRIWFAWEHLLFKRDASRHNECQIEGRRRRRGRQCLISW